MTTVGPNYAGTGADDASVGTRTWSNPGNITASDNSDASVEIQGATSHYLKATNFGFSIPSGATIDGILVEFEKQESSSTTDNSIRIVKGDTISGDEKSAGATWPATDTFVSYGGASDLWGLTWTAADINASDFGAVISCTRGSAESSQFANVDSVRITIYYTATGTNTQINIGDSWKSVDAMKINIGDSWKDVVAVKINIGDTWKDVF